MGSVYLTIRQADIAEIIVLTMFVVGWNSQALTIYCRMYKRHSICFGK